MVPLVGSLDIRGKIFADPGDRGEEGIYDFFTAFPDRVIRRIAEFIGKQPERGERGVSERLRANPV